MDMQELKKVAEARWGRVLSDLPQEGTERVAALENEGMLVVRFDDARQTVEFVDDNSGEIVASII